MIVEASDKDGVAHAVRMVSYIEGTPLATVTPQTPELLADLGRFVGRLTNRLASFEHPAARRDFYWDVRNGERVVNEFLPADPRFRPERPGGLPSRTGRDDPPAPMGPPAAKRRLQRRQRLQRDRRPARGRPVRTPEDRRVDRFRRHGPHR